MSSQEPSGQLAGSLAPYLLLPLALSAPAAAQGSEPPFDDMLGRWQNYATGPIQPTLWSADGALIYDVNQPGSRLGVLGGASGQTLAEIPTGPGLVSIERRPGTSELWCVDRVTSSVGVIDLASLSLIRTIRVGAEPHGIAFSASGDRAYVSCSAVDRVDVIDADAYALAASIDVPARNPRGIVRLGDTIYVAPLLSGNGTAPRGNPATGWTDDVVEVRHVDELPGTQPLPDRDLFAIPITASAATDAIDPDATVRGLGTILFNLHVRPGTSELWIPHTDALNGVKQGDKSFVEGQVVRNRIAIVDVAGGGEPQIVDLDALIPIPERRCAEPTGVAFTSDGGRAFVFGYGSDSVAVLDVESGGVSWAGTIRILPTGPYPDGAGPRAGAVSPDDQTLVVHNKGEGSLTLIDLAELPGRKPFYYVAPTAFAPGYNPTPAVIRQGRIHFIRTQNSKSMTSSCNSCHVDAHIDGLAWNLGSFLDPEETPPGELAFPLDDKGPMVTQTLRRLPEVGPYHWRGEKKDLADFNGTFVDLFERQEDGETKHLGGHFLYIKQYMEHLPWPPNPRQELDRSLTSEQAAGLELFRNKPVHEGLTCADCHPLPLTSAGEIVDHRLGGLSKTIVVPSLRGVAEKLTPSFDAGGDFGTVTELGAGLLHGGGVESIRDHLLQFTPPPASVRLFDLSPTEADQIAAFLEALDTGMAPSTGFQVTAHAGNAASVLAGELAFLMDQAAAGHCELVYRYGPDLIGGLRQWRSGLYDPSSGLFQQGSELLPELTPAELIAVAESGKPVTFVGVPLMMGLQMGLDRDVDGLRDLDERLHNTHPEKHDTDGDGFPDGYEVLWGMDPRQQDGSSPDADPPTVEGTPTVHYTTLHAAKLEFRASEAVRVLVSIDDGGPVLRFPLQSTVYDDHFAFVVSGLAASTTHQIRLTLTDPAGNQSEHAVPVTTATPKALVDPVHVESISLEVVEGHAGPDPTLEAELVLRAGDAPPAPGYNVKGSVFHWSPVSGLTMVQPSAQSWLVRPDGVATVRTPIPSWVPKDGGVLYFVLNALDAPPGEPPYVEAEDVESVAVTAY